MLDLILVTGPAVTPVDLAAAKAQLHIDADDDDQNTLIEEKIAAATEDLDGPAGSLGRALITQTWTLYLDRFPHGHDRRAVRRGHRADAIRLPLPPLMSVTSITYTDGAGEVQALPPDQYVVREGEMAVVEPAYGCCWPWSRCQPRAIAVTFVAGYGDAPAAVPAPIRSALLLMVGDLFENRETTVIDTRVAQVVSKTMDRLLFKFRRPRT